MVAFVSENKHLEIQLAEIRSSTDNGKESFTFHKHSHHRLHNLLLLSTSGAAPAAVPANPRATTIPHSLSLLVDHDLVVMPTKHTRHTHTDANYICATIDWWPDDKCNYNHCPCGSASALNLDLSNPILTKLVNS